VRRQRRHSGFASSHLTLRALLFHRHKSVREKKPVALSSQKADSYKSRPDSETKEQQQKNTLGHQSTNLLACKTPGPHLGRAPARSPRYKGPLCLEYRLHCPATESRKRVVQDQFEKIYDILEARRLTSIFNREKEAAVVGQPCGWRPEGKERARNDVAASCTQTPWSNSIKHW